MTYRVERTTDPAAFLALARDRLEVDPVLSTVVSTTLQNALLDPVPPSYPRWWAAVLDGDEVVGVVTRSAPFRPYPLYLLPMPEEAARTLAGWLLAEGEDVRHANGARATVEHVMEALAQAHGGSTRVLEHDRLWEATSVVAPTGVDGRSRLATADDLDLVAAWCRDFLPAAARQAGRPPVAGEGDHLDRDWSADRIERGLMWLWEVEGRDGSEVVHLTGRSPAALGVARVGPVYTPVAHRGHGYAAALVAQVTEGILATGDRACLFTDVENPVSNAVYERLGYRPLAELVRMEVASEVTTPAPA